MKGLNKLVLASAIAAISAGANAELKALDDSAMGELTGQAGLTIDIETKYTIGEFAYKDGGSVLFQGISMQGGAFQAYGPGNDKLDNIRLNLDVAGAGTAAVDAILDDPATTAVDESAAAIPASAESLHYGFSEITELAALIQEPAYGNTDLTIKAIAAGAANLNTKKTFGDGDLVIHIDATDHLKAGGGMAQYLAGTGGHYLGAAGGGDQDLSEITFDEIKKIVHTAVDFNFSIDAIKIASSDYVIGSGSASSGNHVGGEVFTDGGNATTLISGLSIQGFLGPVDIQIENNGNGFNGSTAADASGNADSKIHWDTYIDVTDLDVYIDIAGVQISDMKINNMRGDTTDINYKESFGFAHSERTIYAVKDAVLNIGSAAVVGGNPEHYVDGIAINTVFKGDMEIGALSFGDTGTSIGGLYWTDMSSTTNWTISAH